MYNFNQLGFCGQECWPGQGDDATPYFPKHVAPFALVEVAGDVIKDDDHGELGYDYARGPSRGDVRSAAYVLLGVLGYNPNRFGEPEKARLMMFAAKTYVNKSLDRRTSGLDALIALFHQTADSDGTAFLHSFIPALCRRIREWCGDNMIPDVSLDAERFLLANALDETAPDWSILGEAIYGEVEFADLLRRTPAISKKLRAQRLAATA